MNQFFFSVLLFSQTSFASNDPLFSEQWYLLNTGQVHREEITDIKSNVRPGLAGADLGWVSVAQTLKFEDSNRPKVAVVDTGVDYEHEDLVHSILLNEAECENGDIPLGEATEDRDGNGYNGDCKGINLVTRDKLQKNRPLDKEIGHGTHLAGLISAKWNNSLGIAGVHEDIQILPIKAISDQEARQRRPLNERVAEAIRYAVSRGVDVINLSLGYPIARDTADMRQAVQEAHAAGVFIVAAAGNNAHGVPVYPCAYEEVICVGSVRNDGERSEFSNYGAHVDVYAPGEFIMSTFPTILTPSFSAVKAYEVKSGTSQAAPLVSAGLALLRRSQPNKSHLEIRNQFFRSLDSDRVFRLDKAIQQRGELKNYRLLFKDFSVAKVNSDLLVSVPVKLQNLNSQSQNFLLKLPNAVNSKVSLKLAPGEIKDIELSYKLADLQISHTLNLELLVNGHKEKLSVSVARPFSDVEQVKALPIANSREARGFNSVSDLTGQSQGEYFYEVLRNKEPKGIKLKLWKREADSVVFVGEKVLLESVSVRALYQADVNADGVEDLMAIGLGVDGEANTLHIHYLNTDLSPLFTETGLIKKPGMPIFMFSNFLEPQKTRWIYKDFGSDQKILVPAIVDNGYLAHADQSKRQRRRGGAARANHIYTLELTENSEAEPIFETRVIDNASWVAAVRKKYSLRHYESVEPIMALSDSAQFLVRIGQLANSRYLLVFYDGKVWTEELLNWPRDVYGFQPVKVYDESSGEALTGLFGRQSKSRAELIVLNPENINDLSEQVLVDLPDESEHIVRALLISKNQNQLKLVFEAGQKLFGFVFEDLVVRKAFERTLPRTTFFGDFLTQVNAIVQGPKGRAWIYVDDTQVNVNSMRLQSFSAETGFQTLLRDSYSVEAHCMPLNPARYSLHILCRNGEGLELRSLPMQVNTH